jgi:PGF-pre-PGF domain-containing protein/PGF-CTERM protein
MVVGVASTPAAAQQQNGGINIGEVTVPDSVTSDESFDIEVDVDPNGDIEEIDVTLGLPSQLTCSPSGSQTVASDGSETATFSCEADASGDYNGEITVTATSVSDSGSNDGETISDSTQTGLTVSSPASLSMTTDLDAGTIDEGSSTELTVSVSNSGDVSTSYDLSMSSDSGLSESLASGSESGSIDGGDTVFVTYTLTGDSTGDQDATVTTTGGNGQEIARTETVSVESTGGGGGGGGGGSPTPTSAEPKVIEDFEEIDTPADIEPKRAERSQIAVDEETGQARVTFTEESSTESIVFEDGDVEGEVTVAEYDSEPEETGASPGRSLSVTQIEVPDPDKSATIRKRVSSERLEEIDADAEDLRINRFNEAEGEWQGLETEAVETTDERVVLEAETPGFSFFSVSATSEPEAVIDAPSEIDAGEEFTLDATGSSAEYGDIVAYEWTVDGDTLSGETVTTAIDAAGDLTVELTVENDAGETDTATATVSVRETAEPEAEDGTEDDTESEDGTEPESEPDDQPGFGAVVALFGVLVATLLARRRA